MKNKPGVVVCAFNSSTLEADAGSPLLILASETLSQEEEVEEEEARMGMKEKGDRREWVGEELSCSRDSV